MYTEGGRRHAAALITPGADPKLEKQRCEATPEFALHMEGGVSDETVAPGMDDDQAPGGARWEAVPLLHP